MATQTSRKSKTIVGGFGSLQEGVIGKELDKLPLNQYCSQLNQWVELFIYTLVAWDLDKHGRNVMQESGTKRLVSIDNQLSGGSPLSREQPPFPININQVFATHRVIPAKYIAKLENFVKNRRENTLKLLPYYTPQVIKGIFERAEYLIKHPQIRNLKDIHNDMLHNHTVTYNCLVGCIDQAYKRMLDQGAPPKPRSMMGWVKKLWGK